MLAPDCVLQAWQAEGRIVPICPELEGGLGVPRPSAEISANGSGENVLHGPARVLTVTGIDVTDNYLAGAQAALALAQSQGCRFALLADGSPSCGSSFIYDGRFSGVRRASAGVTTALLRAKGIAVFSESELDALKAAVG